MKRTTHRLAAVVTAVTLAALSGCSLPSTSAKPDDAPVKAADAEHTFPSQFTRDGTFQSHIRIDNIDFVYTLWPTKSTPRTHEWFARGKKHFSFSLTAYDLDRRLRDKFATKRKVYLKGIQVSSKTTGAGPSESPYRLDAVAARITFDPEPVRTRYGMLITSPKGAFELRNQRVRPVALGTRGMTLTFRATVMVQSSHRSPHYMRRVIRQQVPITIFPGKQRTRSTQIPIDAN